MKLHTNKLSDYFSHSTQLIIKLLHIIVFIALIWLHVYMIMYLYSGLSEGPWPAGWIQPSAGEPPDVPVWVRPDVWRSIYGQEDALQALWPWWRRQVWLGQLLWQATDGQAPLHQKEVVISGINVVCLLVKHGVVIS